MIGRKREKHALVRRVGHAIRWFRNRGNLLVIQRGAVTWVANHGDVTLTWTWNGKIQP